MKKITILLSEREEENVLVDLRKLGTVHVKNIEEPIADDITSLEGTIQNTKDAIALLEHYGDNNRTKESDLNATEIKKHVEEIVSLSKEREHLSRCLSDVEEEIEWFKPWGSFNVRDMEVLNKRKVFIKLYEVSKKDFKKVEGRKDIYIIKENKNRYFFAFISRDANENLPFEEAEPPTKDDIKTLEERRKYFIDRTKEIEIIFRSKSNLKDVFRKHLLMIEGKYDFLNVMHGMKKEEKFSYLQGFSPVNKIKDIIALSKSDKFGYMIEEPDEPSEAPTLIKNPRWINIINPVFKFMNIIPGYKEYDISLWFLGFFSLFFAMLIGDAGYGILFFALTLFARRKLRKAPKEIFYLLYVLSIATIVWGAVTGTWFGSENIAKIPFFKALTIEKISSFSMESDKFLIYLCLLIGVIHLSIAHLIIISRIYNSIKVLAEFGWIFVLWSLFFIAGTFILGSPFPSIWGNFFIVGTVLIFVFSDFQKNILKGIMNSLLNVPLRIISSFADIVSYMRLFAVSYASLMLASTFNNMVLNIGFNNLLATMGAAFILFGGHILNMLLGIMAVIVHGVRLNLLEFSGHLGMEWSGKEYAPFREEIIT